MLVAAGAGGCCCGWLPLRRNHPAHTWSLDSGLQTWEAIALSCFKPASLWLFVNAAPAHQYPSPNELSAPKPSFQALPLREPN